MENIPKETLCHILQFLPSRDIKQCRLVSRTFHDAASERKLWKEFELCVTARNCKSLKTIFELSLLYDLKSVIFTGCAMKNDHVKLLIQKDIQYLQIGQNHDIDQDCDVAKVSTKLLAKLISKLQVFKFI